MQVAAAAEVRQVAQRPEVEVLAVLLLLRAQQTRAVGAVVVVTIILRLERQAAQVS